MRTARNLFGLKLSQFFLPCQAPAQVTHGQKPSCPRPFASNISRQRTGRNGHLPPGSCRLCRQGFRVNVFATNFKRPRWLTVGAERGYFSG